MAMATLDLSSKVPRRTGMTRRGKQFQGNLLESLPRHRDRAKASILDVDVDALPISSDSSRGSSPIIAKVEGQSGDSSGEENKSRKRRNPSSDQDTKQENCSSLIEKNSRSKREIPCESSNIPRTRFTSGKSSTSRNGSQSSPKRRKDYADDCDIDMLDTFGSQRKKAKTTYSSSSQNRFNNIHTKGPPKGREKGGKKSISPKVEKGRPEFQAPPIIDEALFANYEKEMADSRKPVYRKPPSHSPPRSATASQESITIRKGSSQENAKFIAPKKLSPQKAKARPTFKIVLAVPQEVSTSSSESVSTREPLGFISSNTSGTVQNAATVAASKLGISAVKFIPPPSSTDAISTPPPSIDIDFPSSPLSSLENEYPDVDQENRPIVRSEDLKIPERPGQVCQICKEIVENEIWEELSLSKERLSIRQQAQFCKAHKIRKAHLEWKRRGYPDIDWSCLVERISKYHAAIEDILRGRKFSFYRNAFEDLVKSGKNRSTNEDIIKGNAVEGLSPGYYGSRGNRVMLEHIMSNFAIRMRRLAPSDNLLSSSGLSAYVQAVLVPELATLLIADDMQVEHDHAREILRESVDIGHLLNEEEDEMIRDPDGDREGTQVIREV